MHWNEQYTRRNLIRALLVGAVTVGLGSVASLASEIWDRTPRPPKRWISSSSMSRRIFPRRRSDFFTTATKRRAKIPVSTAAIASNTKKSEWWTESMWVNAASSPKAWSNLPVGASRI